MKHFEFYFKREQERDPFAGDIICLTRAVRNRKFSPQIIHKWFNHLIDKSDYSPSDKKTILKQIEELSNAPLRARKTGERGTF